MSEMAERGMFDGLKNGTAGIFRGMYGEYRPTPSEGNELIVEAGAAYFPYYNRRVLHYYDGWGDEKTPGRLAVPDGRSRIVIRTDYKRQESRIVVLRPGWRGWRLRLSRWMNRLTRRYADIPICEIECLDGRVTQVNDQRQYAEYHA